MPRHATGLGTAGFPAANKLLMRYEADRAYKLHQQRLQNTRHKLDVKTPQRHNHLILRLKQIQKEEERQAEIDHENKILLNKMTHVMKYGGNIDNWNNYESRSLNYPLREKQNEEVARQNIAIARRLETVRPGLHINSWERDYQQHRYLRSLWNDSTKDFGEFSPRRYRSRMSHAVKRSMDNLDDTYDEDFNSVNSESDEKHLPKLNKNKKDPRKAKSEANAPASPRKEEHKGIANRQTKLPKIVPHRALVQRDFSMYYGNEYESTPSTERSNTFRKSHDDKDDSQSTGRRTNRGEKQADNNIGDKKDRKSKKSDRKNADSKDQENNKELNVEANENGMAAKSQGSFQSVNIVGNDLERVKTLISEEKDKEMKEDDKTEGANTVNDDAEKGTGQSVDHADDDGGANYREVSNEEKANNDTDADLFFDQNTDAADTKSHNNGIDAMHKEKTVDNIENDSSDKQGELSKHENDRSEQDNDGDQNAIHTDNDDKSRQSESATNKQQNGSVPHEAKEVDTTDKLDNDNSARKNSNEEAVTKKKKRKKSKEDGVTHERKKEDKEDKSDVAQLFKIAKQLGKPEDIFIKTLIKKTHKQRMTTKAKFRQKYDLDLISELKTGLGNNWENLIDALLQERGVADAYAIFDALSTEDVIDVVELLATRTNAGIAELKESYRKEFSISLEEDIADRTPKPVQTLLIVLQKGMRDESTEVDDDAARKDAEDLFKAVDGRWDQEDGKFLQLLNVQSFAHMKSVLVKYKQVSGGEDVMAAMKQDCDKSYFQAIKVLVSCIANPDVYLASQLRKHKNPTDPLFINILVLRSEIDMPSIRKIYKKTYGVDITDEIKIKPHPTQKCLVELALKGPPPKEQAGDSKKTAQPAAQQQQAAAKEPGKKAQAKKAESKTKAEQESDDKKTEATAKSKPVSEDKPKQSKGKQDNPENQQDANNVAAGSKSKKPDNKSKVPASTSVANNGTVKPTNNFRPDNDCDRLNNALTAEPVHENEVLAIIPKRSNKQRQDLKKMYEQKFKKNLMIDLESEMPGDTEEITLALMMTPIEYDAYCLHEAVEGLGTSEPVLIAVLCTRPGSDIAAMKDTYKTAYKSDMIQDVTRDSSGEFKNLLTLLCQGRRETGSAVNMNQADKDAKTLVEGLDPSSDLFKSLLTERNHYQVKATFDSYRKLSGQDIYTGLTKAGLGDDEEGYISIAKAVEDPVEFHVQTLGNCFNNMGVNDNLLIRMVVPRSEVDLVDIKDRYSDVKGQSLYQTVSSQSHGDYTPLLLAVIDNPEKEEKTKGKKQTTSKKSPTGKQDKAAVKPSSNGTVMSAKDFNPSTDSERLHKAMDGFGTDEAVIIDILPKRSNNQRQDLKKKYKELYQKDLQQQLKSELRGDFEEVILALMMVPVEYDAYCLHEAVDGLGTNEGILIGILCTRTAQELTEIKAVYKNTYGTDLQLDLTQDTSGGLEDMVVQLLKCERDQSTKVDQEQAKKDALKLYKDGQISIDPTDDTFREVLTKKSRAQVRATFEEYKKVAGNDIYKGIDKALMGDAEKGYKFLAKAIEDPVQFYAERLHDSFEGLGTNDTQLIRIVVSRSEIDLETIKQCYKSLYKKTLSESIESECSGDYKKTLLAVVGPDK